VIIAVCQPHDIIQNRFLAKRLLWLFEQFRAGDKWFSVGFSWLASNSDNIRLNLVFAAVEEPPGPGFRPEGNAMCPVGRAAPGVICALIGEMNQAVEAVLARETLADLLKKLEASEPPA